MQTPRIFFWIQRCALVYILSMCGISVLHNKFIEAIRIRWPGHLTSLQLQRNVSRVSYFSRANISKAVWKKHLMKKKKTKMKRFRDVIISCIYNHTESRRRLKKRGRWCRLGIYNNIRIALPASSSCNALASFHIFFPFVFCQRRHTMLVNQTSILLLILLILLWVIIIRITYIMHIRNYVFTSVRGFRIFFPECAHSSKASRVLTLVINPSSPTRSLSYFTILSRVTLEPHLNFTGNTLARRTKLITRVYKCISGQP